MEPEGFDDCPVKRGEEVAFQWIHEGNRKVVSRCVRLQYSPLPPEWAKEEWPPMVGEWTPISQIGRGGNGEVWKAQNRDGQVVAVKYLHRTEDDRYKRFIAETQILQALKGVDGIVPMLACGLPKQPSLTNPAWFAMPLATTLQKWAEGKGFEELVDAFAQLSATLAALAKREIAHRDIKPENLFWLNDRAAVGDFGLVDFPGKEMLTVPFKRLGPMFYLAPEMLNEPHTAKGEPADVYALAKSLWVMASGQTYPIPGEYRDAIYQTRLSTLCWSSQGQTPRLAHFPVHKAFGRGPPENVRGGAQTEHMARTKGIIEPNSASAMHGAGVVQGRRPAYRSRPHNPALPPMRKGVVTQSQSRRPAPQWLLEMSQRLQLVMSRLMFRDRPRNCSSQPNRDRVNDFTIYESEPGGQGLRGSWNSFISSSRKRLRVEKLLSPCNQRP